MTRPAVPRRPHPTLGRAMVTLQHGDRVSFRMPTSAERFALGTRAGETIIAVTRVSDGGVELFAYGQVWFTLAEPLRPVEAAR